MRKADLTHEMWTSFGCTTGIAYNFAALFPQLTWLGALPVTIFEPSEFKL